MTSWSTHAYFRRHRVPVQKGDPARGYRETWDWIGVVTLAPPGGIVHQTDPCPTQEAAIRAAADWARQNVGEIRVVG